MSVRGDFARLDKLGADVGGLARAASRRALLDEVGGQALELARAGAAAGRDPSGRRWKPRVDGGDALPNAAGELEARVRDSGFELVSETPFAKLHARGATIQARRKLLAFPGRDGPRFAGKVVIPARAILPAGGRLPAPWERALHEKADAWMRDRFGQ